MAQAMANGASQFVPDLADETLLGSVQPGEDAAADGRARIVLKVEDLVQDENGEIVLFNDSHVPSVALETTAKLVDEGEMPEHVTAAGENVTGFHFWHFDSGLKIYFKDGVDMVLVEPTPTV